MALYNASAVGVKAVHPSLKVGGPATEHLNTQNFLSQAKAIGAPVDFVSSHNYPTGPRGDGSGCPQGAQWDPECFRDRVLAARAKIPTAIPFALTEYSVMVGEGMGLAHGQEEAAGAAAAWRKGEPPYQHDDSGAAAFVFRVVPQLAPSLEVMSYWTFSDVFEENSIPVNEFRKQPYGTSGDNQPHYGAMSVHGVPKPVWRAFQLLHTHAGTHSVSTSTSAVTNVGRGGTRAEGQGQLEKLISAHATVNTSVSGDAAAAAAAIESGSGRLLLSHWDATGAAKNHSAVAVTVTLRCGESATVNCAAAVGGSSEIWMVDGTTAANELWESMGAPSVPSSQQLTALKKHSVIHSKPLKWTSTREHVLSGEKVLKATVSMPPNSACVVTL